MNLDFNKSLRAAKLPTIILIFIIILIAIANSLIYINIYYLIILFFLAAVYSGYIATKTHNLNLVNAGLTGSITDVIGFVFTYLLVEALIIYLLGGAEPGIPLIGKLVQFSSFSIISFILGFIAATIGALIGQKF